MRRWFRFRRQEEAVPLGRDLLTSEAFETELEKRAVTMLGMSLGEFRALAADNALPDTPAVDHLRFLLGV